jgi:hypothetical protein
LLRHGERPLLPHQANLDHISAADREMVELIASTPKGGRTTLPTGCIARRVGGRRRAEKDSCQRSFFMALGMTPFGNELGFRVSLAKKTRPRARARSGRS